MIDRDAIEQIIIGSGSGAANRGNASYMLPEIVMPSVKFTKALVAQLSLAEGEKEKIYFDTALPGFGLRLQGKSARWIAQYRVNGVTRRTTFGRREVVDLEKARVAAREVLSKAGLGIDTQEEKKKARRTAHLTLGSVIDTYLEAYKPIVRPNTFRGARMQLKTHWKPLHSMALDQISHTDISARVAALRKDIGIPTGDHARVVLSGLYGWAITEGLVNDNPVARTRSSRLVKAKSGETLNGGRARTLSPGELAEVWQACEDNDFGRIVRLLILTLQRREEIGRLEWSEVDVNNAIINLPPARTKNGREHLVPISTAAAAILATIEMRAGREYLFGAFGKGAFSNYSKSKQALDARVLQARLERDPSARPMPHWTLHDLRRTGVTMMNESPPLGLGMPPHIVEAIVNHISGSKAGIAGVYNRALYFTEKVAALEAWGQHVEQIVKA